MRRGDILAILPRECIVVFGCVFTHPAAASYLQAASNLARFAAAKAETSKRRAFELFGDGVGYEFVLLAGESFGRSGKEAARFLFNLLKTAASDSCDSTSAVVKTVQQELSAMCPGDATMYGRSLLALA